MLTRITSVKQTCSACGINLTKLLMSVEVVEITDAGVLLIKTVGNWLKITVWSIHIYIRSKTTTDISMRVFPSCPQATHSVQYCTTLTEVNLRLRTIINSRGTNERKTPNPPRQLSYPMAKYSPIPTLTFVRLYAKWAWLHSTTRVLCSYFG